jgi:hypothetical protein
MDGNETTQNAWDLLAWLLEKINQGERKEGL